jgi:DNA-binding MarR family transcriptional regulator
MELKSHNYLLNSTFYNYYNFVDLMLKYKENNQLTVKELYFLKTIDSLVEKKENNISDISIKLNISISRASQAVSILVKKEYLTREHDKKDRRVYIVELTPKAKSIIEFEHEISKKFLENLDSQLNVDQKQLISLVLAKINDLIKRDNETIKKLKSLVKSSLEK